eukprot:Filipodium_phascolosomae@DN1606_c0_g1_i1.p1
MKKRVFVRWGIRHSKRYRDSLRAAYSAKLLARDDREKTGFIVDQRDCLRFGVKQNYGFNFFRSLQVIKHLEMHSRGSLLMTPETKQRIALIGEFVKQGK